MNALADKVHKQEVPHSDMHMHSMKMAPLFNNHPYIVQWHTYVLTYVGMVVE